MRPPARILLPLCAAAFALSQSACGLSAISAALVVSSSSSSSSNSSTPAPKVTAISPATGEHAGGVTITITGENFPVDATVSVGGQQATGVVVNNGGSLTATLPASSSLGAKDVVVTNPVGGSGTLAGSFTFTNTPAVVELPALSSPQSQNVVIPVTLKDAASDLVALKLEFSSGGGAFAPIPSADLVIGDTGGLTSKPAGVTHTISWNSRGSFPGQDAKQVRLRVTPTDTIDQVAGSAVVSAPFDLTNNSMPTLSLVQPSNDSFQVALFYTVADPDSGDTLTVTSVSYADVNAGTSGAATLIPVAGQPTVPGSVSFSATGRSHSLLWDSFKDLSFGNNRQVTLTLTLSDGTQTVQATTSPFFISNGPLSDQSVLSYTLSSPNGHAVADVNSDGLVDLLIADPQFVGRRLNLGQEFASATRTPLFGASTPVPQNLTWNGTTTVTADAAPTGLAIGDWIGLPFNSNGIAGATLFGDPVGPRWFRITNIAGTTITIHDNYGYLGTGVLPGGAAFAAGNVSGAGFTRVVKPGLGVANALPPGFQPGAMAGLSVDDPIAQFGSKDLVVVGNVPPPIATATTALATAGASTITVASLAPGTPATPFQVGMWLSLGTGGGAQFRVIQAITAPSTLTLNNPLGANLAAASRVVALTKSTPFHAGHIANHSFGVLTVKADGSFAPISSITATGGRYPQHAIAAEVAGFNGAVIGAIDSATDLVIVNASSTANALKGSVSIFLRNRLQATFRAPITVQTGLGAGGTAAGSTHAVVADINSDSIPDIVVANTGENSVSYLVQNPVGTFTETIVNLKGVLMFPAGDAISVAVADFDRDGLADLAVMGIQTQRLIMLKGTDPAGALPLLPGGNPASPTYLIVRQTPAAPSSVAGFAATQPGPFLFTNTQPARIGVGDLNSDGLPDIVVPSLAVNRIQTFMNQGVSAGVLGFRDVSHTSDLAPFEAFVLDVNGDARDDVVVGGRFVPNMSVFLQTTPGTLDKFVPIPVGIDPLGAEVADLTSSSIGNEIVVTLNSQASVQILGQNGANGFVNLSPSAGRPDVSIERQLKASVVPGPAASDPRTILPTVARLGDFNADGRLDLAVVVQAVIPTTPASGGAVILLNEGGIAPIKTTSKVLIGASQSFTLATGPLLGGAGQDVVIASLQGGAFGTGSLKYYPGDGAGGFGAVTEVLAPGVSFPAATDVDGDGDTDILAALGSSAPTVNFTIVRQNAGALLAPIDGVPGGIKIPGMNSVTGIRLGDFNNDGALDVLLHELLSNTVAIAFRDLGSNPPTFSVVVQQLSLPSPLSTAVGDLNNDGLLDFAVAFSTQNKVGVYIQRAGTAKAGAKSMLAPYFLPAGTNPYGTAIGDVNSDGKADLIVSARGSGTLNVFFQR